MENATIASEWCGVQRSGICSCIAGNYITNGKHPETGESLNWMFYKNYVELNKEDCKEELVL